MANVNAPFGFRPSRHKTGLGQTLGNKYKIASGLAENIGIGDLVKSDGAGGIQKAGVTDTILGVFMGWHYETGGISSKSHAGSQTATIPFGKNWVSGTTVPTNMVAVADVHDDPFETFEVQSSQTIVEADIGTFVNMVDAAPSTVYGRSNQTVGATGGAVFRIERILQKPQRQVDANNNTTGHDLSGAGQYAVLEVICVKHERGGTAMAVSV